VWFRHLDYTPDAAVTDLGPVIDGLFARNICVVLGNWWVPAAVPALRRGLVGTRVCHGAINNPSISRQPKLGSRGNAC
jgi:hypothetical protein